MSESNKNIKSVQFKLENEVDQIKFNFNNLLLKLILDELPFFNPFYDFNPSKRVDLLIWIRNKKK